ncbi:MAG TPA: hypothetical protein VFA02_08335 [Pseudacidobacterium sp.]|nr:hypothetical protein [Pseudacidobacterium sp.]
MEIFSNLVWVAISLALGTVWLIGYRHSDRENSMPGLRVQCVALAMLILILLPVVSLSDDMQAMVATSEVEHVNRRIDMLPVNDHAAEPPLLFSGPVDLHTSLHLRTFAWMEPVYAEARPLDGCLREMANRPPPVCALFS